MPIKTNQATLQINEIDSSGSIYNQKYANSPLDKKFLKIEYINYSGLESQNTVSIAGENDNSGKSFLSFEYSDLILIILIGMFSLIAYVKLSGKNYFNRLIMSVQNYSYSVSFYREKNLAIVLYNNIMIFVFLLCAGMVSTHIAEYFNISFPGVDKFVQFLVYVGTIAFLILLNRVVVRISGVMFGHNRITSEYLFYYNNLLRFLGIVFLILSVILFFMNQNSKFLFVYFSILIGATAYLVKSIRILVIFFNNKLSLYYLILYFCALEIIPVVLIIKIFTRFIHNGYSFSGILV